MLGAGENFVQVVDLFVGEQAFGFAADNACETKDSVQRRAQLMAHVGKEGALGLIGLFGGSAGLFRFIEKARLQQGRPNISSKGVEKVLVVDVKDVFSLGALHADDADRFAAHDDGNSEEGPGSFANHCCAKIQCLPIQFLVD